MPVAERGAGRRLPYHRIAHDRGRGGEIAADCGEVERRDGVHEPLEGPVFHPVPHSWGAHRLLRVELLGEVDVEPQEVDELASAVDLRLERGLALAQHRRPVDYRAPGAGQPVRRLEEHRGPVLEPPAGPLPLGQGRCLDRLLHRLLVGLVHLPQHVLVSVRAHHWDRLRAPDLLASRHHRDVGYFAPERTEGVLELLPLGRPRRVRQHWLIDWCRDVGYAVHGLCCAFRSRLKPFTPHASHFRLFLLQANIYPTLPPDYARCIVRLRRSPLHCS